MSRFIAAFALCAAAAFSQSAPPANYQGMVKEAKARIKEVDVTGYQKMVQEQKNVVTVDVREDKEWDAGRIKGSIHVGRGVLERDVERAVPDKTATVVLYCGGGSRSALAAETLLKMGYQNVFSLKEGFGGYSKAGLPVEK